jgi:hypothetical protein
VHTLVKQDNPDLDGVECVNEAFHGHFHRFENRKLRHADALAQSLPTYELAGKLL